MIEPNFSPYTEIFYSYNFLLLAFEDFIEFPYNLLYFLGFNDLISRYAQIWIGQISLQ